MRIVLSLVLLTACGDDACHREGAARCDGEARLVCESGEWNRHTCEAPTPHCAAQGFHAACIGERVGTCTFSTFEDRCVDEHTLDDCAEVAGGEAIRHRVTCPEHQLCGEVPPGALGDARPPNARFGCHEARAHGGTIVAFVRGDVRVAGAPAPNVPFRIPEGAALELADGAHAVVLSGERASQLDGPRTIAPGELEPETPTATDEASALGEVMAGPPPPPIPDEVLLSPAPIEPGRVVLIVGEGVPGAASRLDTVRWRCDGDCGEVELAQQGGQVLWRGTGEGIAPYTGPELDAPATYTLRVGEHRYRVDTVRPLVMRDLLASMHGWPLADRMSVVAAVHLWRGSRAAAISALELGVRDHDPLQTPALVALLAFYRGPTR